jgi:alcohol dehydrogenase class IV
MLVKQEISAAIESTPGSGFSTECFSRGSNPFVVSPLPGQPAAIFGRGALDRLPQLLELVEAKRTILIHGQSAISHIAPIVSKSSGTSGSELSTLNLPSKLTLDALNASQATILEANPDTIIGLGGGSVLDLAKILSLCDGSPVDPFYAGLAQNLVPSKSRRLILIPTTAGSGSEMTSFATIWGHEAKLSCESPALYADIVIVDPNLAASCPRPVTISAGLDALSQSVESTWAIAGTDRSRSLARESFSKILATLPQCARHDTLGTDVFVNGLCWGASVAGAAIDISKTTAAHGLSYPLTARYGIPHGIAVALILPWLLKHHLSSDREGCLWPSGAEDLKREIEILDQACLTLHNRPLGTLMHELIQAAGFPTKIDLNNSDKTILLHDWQLSLSSVRIRNHPWSIRPEALEALLAEISQ